MSSRQLKKLRQQQELLSMQAGATSESKPGAEEDEEEEEDAPELKPRPHAFAGFAALAGDDDEENDVDDDEDDAAKQGEDEVQPTTASTPAKKSKKSKKKKKGKKASAEIAIEPASEPKEDLDDIDRALLELQLSQQKTANTLEHSGTGDEQGQRLSWLLRINYQQLKVMNEMRKLFGREAIGSAEAEDETQAASNRRRGAGRQNVDLETALKAPPGRGLSDVIAKRNPFIEGKSTWPRASAGGLTMIRVDDGQKGEVAEFAFSHDKAYDAMEAAFFVYVQMGDPMRLVQYLIQNPYHVSTLIQVSKVARQDQNNALAAELCERALFTLGRVTLSTFRKMLEEGKARMDFSRPENRQFYLAGYLYIKSLIQKGTYKTALEWTKLYLSIDPSDPYAVLNWIHALAIRAHESQWFVDLCNTGYLDGKLAAKNSPTPYARQTLVLAKLQLGDVDGARAALIEGMETLPWLYCELFSALNLDAPKAIWAVQPRDEDEDLYTQLYIHMTKDLWNNTQATGLLVEAGKAAQKHDLTTLPKSPAVDLGTARFVYLDNTPALMSRVPRGMLYATPNYDFDPLPPPKEENIFSSPAQRYPWDPPRLGDLPFAGLPGAARDGRMEIRNERDMQEVMNAMPPELLEEFEARAGEMEDPNAEQDQGLVQRFLNAFLQAAHAQNPREGREGAVADGGEEADGAGAGAGEADDREEAREPVMVGMPGAWAWVEDDDEDEPNDE